MHAHEDWKTADTNNMEGLMRGKQDAALSSWQPHKVGWKSSGYYLVLVKKRAQIPVIISSFGIYNSLSPINICPLPWPYPTSSPRCKQSWRLNRNPRSPRNSGHMFPRLSTPPAWAPIYILFTYWLNSYWPTCSALGKLHDSRSQWNL